MIAPYDLHQLLKDTKLHEFIESDDFVELLHKVAQDDVISFKNNNEWLAHHPADALIFKDLDRVWEELKLVYNGVFSMLVYGTLPDEKDIYNTMDFLKKRLVQFEWKLKLH